MSEESAPRRSTRSLTRRQSTDTPSPPPVGGTPVKRGRSARATLLTSIAETNVQVAKTVEENNENSQDASNGMSKLRTTSLATVDSPKPRRGRRSSITEESLPPAEPVRKSRRLSTSSEVSEVAEDVSRSSTPVQSTRRRSRRLSIDSEDINNASTQRVHAVSSLPIVEAIQEEDILSNDENLNNSKVGKHASIVEQFAVASEPEKDDAMIIEPEKLNTKFNTSKTPDVPKKSHTSPTKGTPKSPVVNANNASAIVKAFDVTSSPCAENCTTLSSEKLRSCTRNATSPVEQLKLKSPINSKLNLSNQDVIEISSNENEVSPVSQLKCSNANNFQKPTGNVSPVVKLINIFEKKINSPLNEQSTKKLNSSKDNDESESGSSLRLSPDNSSCLASEHPSLDDGNDKKSVMLETSGTLNSIETNVTDVTEHSFESSETDASKNHCVTEEVSNTKSADKNISCEESKQENLSTILSNVNSDKTPEKSSLNVSVNSGKIIVSSTICESNEKIKSRSSENDINSSIESKGELEEIVKDIGSIMSISSQNIELNASNSSKNVCESEKQLTSSNLSIIEPKSNESLEEMDISIRSKADDESITSVIQNTSSSPKGLEVSASSQKELNSSAGSENLDNVVHVDTVTQNKSNSSAHSQNKLDISASSQEAFENSIDHKNESNMSISSQNDKTIPCDSKQELNISDASQKEIITQDILNASDGSCAESTSAVSKKEMNVSNKDKKKYIAFANSPEKINISIDSQKELNLSSDSQKDKIENISICSPKNSPTVSDITKTSSFEEDVSSPSKNASTEKSQSNNSENTDKTHEQSVSNPNNPTSNATDKSENSQICGNSESNQGTNTTDSEEANTLVISDGSDADESDNNTKEYLRLNSDSDSSDYVDKEAQDAGKDYESHDSMDEEEKEAEKQNKFLEVGESLESSDGEDLLDDDYEHDSFCVESKSEDEQLLEGDSEDLESRSSSGLSDLSQSQSAKEKYNSKVLKKKRQSVALDSSSDNPDEFKGPELQIELENEIIPTKTPSSEDLEGNEVLEIGSDNSSECSENLNIKQQYENVLSELNSKHVTEQNVDDAGLKANISSSTSNDQNDIVEAKSKVEEIIEIEEKENVKNKELSKSSPKKNVSFNLSNSSIKHNEVIDDEESHMNKSTSPNKNKNVLSTNEKESITTSHNIEIQKEISKIPKRKIQGSNLVDPNNIDISKIQAACDQILKNENEKKRIRRESDTQSNKKKGNKALKDKLTTKLKRLPECTLEELEQPIKPKKIVHLHTEHNQNTITPKEIKPAKKDNIQLKKAMVAEVVPSATVKSSKNKENQKEMVQCTSKKALPTKKNLKQSNETEKSKTLPFTENIKQNKKETLIATTKFEVLPVKHEKKRKISAENNFKVKKLKTKKISTSMNGCTTLFEVEAQRITNLKEVINAPVSNVINFKQNVLNKGDVARLKKGQLYAFKNKQVAIASRK